jgi:hypothetical protein
MVDFFNDDIIQMTCALSASRQIRRTQVEEGYRAFNDAMNKITASEDDLSDRIAEIGVPIATQKIQEYTHLYCRDTLEDGRPCAKCFERWLPGAVRYGAEKAYEKLQAQGVVE